MRIIYAQFLHPAWRAVRLPFVRWWYRNKTKFTGAYWRQKYLSVKQYDWKKARISDFTFLFRYALKLILIAFTGFFCLYLFILTGLFGSVPTARELRGKQYNVPSEVYSSDNVLLGRYFTQDRTNIRFAALPKHLIDALLATEDVRFYDHHGIDARSTFRVLFKTILFQDERSGGGSTITQQLAKNLYPRSKLWLLSTPINKIREMIIARRLEKVYSKDEIIELYLNTVPMGGNLYSIERGAQRYFDRTVSELSLEQSAVLVGMLKATTAYNPRRNPERSRQRRNTVLSQMAKYNFISAEEAERRKEMPLVLTEKNVQVTRKELAPYFTAYIRPELEEWCKENKKPDGEPYDLNTDGLKIYTTIDSRMQLAAASAVNRRMSRLQRLFDQHWRGRSPWGSDTRFLLNAMKKSHRYIALKDAGQSESEIERSFATARTMHLFTWNGMKKVSATPMDSIRHYHKMLNTGLLSVEPLSGAIKAWVGGINQQFFSYDHVLSKRQAGSTFKPILYTAAIENGIEPCRYFPNRQVSFAGWSPQNADNRYGGEYSMSGALAHSVNTVSAQIMDQTGVSQTVAMARKLGIESNLPEVPSLALGTAEVSLMELVRAYATLAAGGSKPELHYLLKITDHQNKLLLEPEKTGPEQAIDKHTARLMVRIMEGVVEEGSASALRSEFGLQMAIAGKTGTTQEQADGWFIGITPGLVTGVWVGAENPLVRFRTLELGQGARTALPIWGDFTRTMATIDPYYAASTFAPLPPDLLARLSCQSYIPPAGEAVDRPVFGFVNRFFKKLGKNKKGKKSGRGKGKR